MAYNAEQKALAIAIINRYGGMTTEALDAIEAAFGKRVSTSTLHSWLPKTEAKNETVKPKSETETEKTPGALVTPDVMAQADQTLDDLFEAVARRYLQHAYSDDVIADTKGKDAITAAAIAVDKMRLLRGLPTEIVAIVPELVEALRGAGLDPVQAFNDMIAELANADRPGTHSTGEGETVR